MTANEVEPPRLEGFHTLAAVNGSESVWRSTCVCGWSSAEVWSDFEARHRHAAHAWVAEPYMTA